MDFIVGTAGHIDHGKTALVRALTGVDADRLPEEKQRGITIDLGFAALDLGAVKLNFVDVPGHERFVKNMLAGASGIDLVALVVAADAGVMPQTREHFDICRLLGVQSGVVVITKIDVVDDELLELVKLDVAELVQNSFLEHAPVVQVSAKTKAGVEQLKQVLQSVAARIPARRNETIARLPIDRRFSVKGFGAVVTGTLIAGQIAEADAMELLPVKKKVRVRSVQTNNRTVAAAIIGQRAAINLGGIEAGEIERGMLLAPVDALRPTQIFDARVEVLPSAARALKSRQRVRVHTGTSEVLARVHILEDAGEIVAGEFGFAQFRLESMIVAVPNQPFIVRSYSPQRTVAGGTIIDGLATRAKRKNLAETRARLEKWRAAENAGDRAAQLEIFLETAGEHGLTKADLRARTAWINEILNQTLTAVLEKESVIAAGETFLNKVFFEKLLEKTVAAIKTHHRSEPLAPGISRETLREKVFARLPNELFRRVLFELEARKLISLEQDTVRAAAHNRDLSVADQALRDCLENVYRRAKLEVPAIENALAQAAASGKSNAAHARRIFQTLLDARTIVRVTAEFYFHRETLAELIAKLRQFADGTPDKLIDVAQFKDLAEVSRKYAIPLLEYLDREKITARAGDKRRVL